MVPGQGFEPQFSGSEPDVLPLDDPGIGCLRRYRKITILATRQVEYSYYMEIVIGADHRGFELKEFLKTWLSGEGHKVTDIGAATHEADDDYPPFAIQVAKKVAEAPTSRRGIVICGSGAGMAVAAGKTKGVRAALIHDSRLAMAARNDDDVNVLALGADYIAPEQARGVVAQFLATPFAGEERYRRRLEQISQYEGHHDN